MKSTRLAIVLVALLLAASGPACWSAEAASAPTEKERQALEKEVEQLRRPGPAVHGPLRQDG